MKRKIYNSIVLLLAVLLFNSCFVDKSGLDTAKIAEIVIDAPSMNSILRVEYLEEVTFSPVVTMEGNPNLTGVSYKWEINQAPGSSDLVVIGTEKVLTATIKKSNSLCSLYLSFYSTR